jgi:hypothetical protein
VNTLRFDPIVRAVLYEGYVLYPYRASSIKNRHRFTFGTLYPPAWCAANLSDLSTMQTECIARVDDSSEIEVAVRYLQLVNRTATVNQDAGHEAVEQQVAVAEQKIASFEEARGQAFVVDAGVIEGEVEVRVTRLSGDLARIRVIIRNLTRSESGTRDEALARSLVSTHTLITVKNGDFVSSFDPPAEIADEVSRCTNTATWPVLIGSDGVHDALLSSPVLLYDYPEIAKESPGDLFDATEIDEILTLRILTLTDAERDEARRSDPRAAALIDRTLALEPKDLSRLHGALRAKRACGAGDRVRLRPKGRADSFDIALAGMTATIQSVEHDFEGRTFFSVTVDDDPGRDLGVTGQPGHRFFFRPEEVELLA